QDQFSAAFGGFSVLRFRDPAADVVTLRVSEAFAAELARRMVLCYTGASHFSGGTITRVMQGYERGDARIVGAMQRLRCLAEEMEEALRSEDLRRLAILMPQNWQRHHDLAARL